MEDFTTIITVISCIILIIALILIVVFLYTRYHKSASEHKKNIGGAQPDQILFIDDVKDPNYQELVKSIPIPFGIKNNISKCFYNAMIQFFISSPSINKVIVQHKNDIDDNQSRYITFGLCYMIHIFF